mmetsp:Transcript_2560/g.5398  ORF Transcript_2560/g.5398 Transcript_2560/m.5398 type:complete len:566 (+) Transcript_2560:1-1698(+)
MAARCTEGFLLQQLGPKAWQRKWCKVTTNGELHCFAKENSAKPPQLTLPLPKFLLAQGAVTKTKLGTSLHQIVLHGDTDTFTFAAEGLELFDDWFEALEMFALSMPAEPNKDQNPTPGVANAKEDKPGPSVPAENLPTSPAASQSHVEKRASQNLARLLKAEARLKADNVELQALVQQQEQQIVVLARRLKGLPAGEVEVCPPAVDRSQQREVDSLQTEVSQLRARVAELEAALAVVHAAGEHDKERVETMSGELDAARSAQGKLRNELQRITAELADEKSKNELLAAQLKALQGQGNSTRPAPPKRVTVSPPPQTKAPQPTPQPKQSPTPQPKQSTTPQPKQSPTPQPKQSPIAQPTQSPSTAEPAARTRRSATMAAPRRVSIVSLKDVTQHECVHCHLVVGGEGKRLKSGGVVHPECLAHAKQAAKEMAAGTCICCGEPLVKVKGKFSGDTMDLGDGELHKECRKAWREKKSHEAHKHAKVCLHCSEPIAPVPGRYLIVRCVLTLVQVHGRCSVSTGRLLPRCGPQGVQGGIRHWTSASVRPLRRACLRHHWTLLWTNNEDRR